MNETYLVHHGIMGQKWGVRRYQNYDGTLKSAGKNHNTDSDFKTKAKKVAKVAGTAALVGAAAYGGYKLANNPAARAAISKAVNSGKSYTVNSVHRTKIDRVEIPRTKIDKIDVHKEVSDLVEKQISQMKKYGEAFDRIDKSKTSNAAKLQAWERAYNNTFSNSDIQERLNKLSIMNENASKIVNDSSIEDYTMELLKKTKL